MAITLEHRKDFVENTTKLSLWLASKYFSEGMQFEEALTKATPVFRFTTLWDGVNHPASEYSNDEWNILLAQLIKELKKSSIEQFEESGMELLKPFLEPRYKKDVEAWPWIPSALGSTNFELRLHGMFLYEITEQNELDLHMGNIYAPKSPFKNVKLLSKTFLLLLKSVLESEKNVEQIVCESWMNSFEPFLTLFPKEWFDNSSKTDMKNYTYDIWGQMMNRFGGYNKPNGDYLRKNGKFPYPSIKCGCSIKLLREHLQDCILK